MQGWLVVFSGVTVWVFWSPHDLLHVIVFRIIYVKAKSEETEPEAIWKWLQFLTQQRNN